MSLLRALVTALTLTLLAGCSAAGSTRDTTDASESTTPRAAPASPVADALPIEGTWRAGPHPVTRVRKALARHDLDRWTEDVLQGMGESDEFVYDLKLQGGGLIFSVTVDGEPMGIWDRESYDVEGSRVVFEVQDGSCSSTWRWRVVDDVLTLSPVKDDCPDYKGVPDVAYMIGLYATAPFVRAGS